jgi:Nif11 domain
MPPGSWQSFREQVLQDLHLQRELMDISDHEQFIARVVQLGQECGYAFTREEVVLAMQTSRHTWMERMLG